jgi:exodeoxyribonuclease V beta subunit
MNAIVRPSEPLDVFTCPLAGVNLIEASAGTGKTWTICGLYLRLLLERGFSVQEILVVTFTNAATAELRERIRARILELRQFLDGPPAGAHDPFIGRLAGDLLAPTALNREILGARLELALHSFDEAAIFTIHGFCQRALADNPFAAGLPMRTELVESDRDLLEETVYDFWRRHVAHAATPEFARHIAAQGDSPRKYRRLLERHLAKPLARHLWPNDLDDPPLAASRMHDSYRAARAQWLTHKTDVGALLTASLDRLNGTSYKPAWLLDAAAHWDSLCGDDDPLAPIGRKAHLFRASFLAGKTRIDGKTKKKYPAPAHTFFDHAEAYLSQREALAHSLFLARCRLLKRLFDEGSSQLQTLKRSRQVVAFNDMLANVHERLHHPGYPWLAASIRTRFPAALIDEFQDTDPLQLGIFRKIYETDASPVFLVGDPKQAIYGFRHADLHSYLRASRWASRQWSLTDNQRSSGRLLTGLNALFGANVGAFVLPEVQYRRIGYGTKPRANFVDSSAARAPLQVWRLPDAAGALPKARAKRASVDATAAEIARLLQAARDGHILLDDRELRPRDIAVLVRSRSLGGDVKRALAELNVGAVELSGDSIFGSPDARDWEIVLIAIASPTRDALLRAALATEIFGLDATALDRLAADDMLLPGWILEFMDYRDLWLKRGFGVMVRQIFADQGVARRLLARPDGERRLTNCLHVAEELQRAAESHPSPEALLRWFKAAQAVDNPVDAAQLRLESDQNLVQIVTIHACKGLEYPIVFCPFLGDGATKFGAAGPEGLEYHDATLQPVIDFKDYAGDDPEFLRISAQIKLEQAAETVRLLYVALTRAVHRCHLVIGPYDTRARYESARSMLNWLAAGNGCAAADWFDSKPTTRELDEAWGRVAAASGGALVIDPLPAHPGVPLRPANIDPATLTTPAPPGSVAAGWRMSSYSGLSYGTRGESAAGDHDSRALAPPTPAGRPADLAPDDILRFPRGAVAGECIHAVFEQVDFSERSGWNSAILAALQTHPQSRGGDPLSFPVSTQTRMLWNMLEHVTTATLIPGLQLAKVPPNRRLTELEFDLPVPHLSSPALNAALKGWGYDVPTLTFGALEGYLKGFIDLVFEHDGRYFILDWKSNHLGYTAADYGDAPLARAMADHGYHLQYLLYAIALDRYLKLRVPGYRYEPQFGGVLYLFVRGVRPAWPATGSDIPGDGTPVPATCGVFFHRPRHDMLRALDDLLGAPRSTGVTG